MAPDFLLRDRFNETDTLATPRQQAVLTVLDSAAYTAGVSANLMRGMWGVESVYGTRLTSPTGCQGDWQFTKNTFAHIIETYGDQIATALDDQNLSLYAENVRYYSDALQEGRIDQNHETLSSLRNDPFISTYAAAFYLQEIAEQIDVDPMDDNSWGRIYAGYNVGPGHSNWLANGLYDQRNAGAYIGEAADNNPIFYQNGATGREALENYHEHVAERINNPIFYQTPDFFAAQRLIDRLAHTDNPYPQLAATFENMTNGGGSFTLFGDIYGLSGIDLRNPLRPLWQQDDLGTQTPDNFVQWRPPSFSLTADS